MHRRRTLRRTLHLRALGWFRRIEWNIRWCLRRLVREACLRWGASSAMCFGVGARASFARTQHSQNLGERCLRRPDTCGCVSRSSWPPICPYRRCHNTGCSSACIRVTCVGGTRVTSTSMGCALALGSDLWTGSYTTSAVIGAGMSSASLSSMSAGHAVCRERRWRMSRVSCRRRERRKFILFSGMSSPLLSVRPKARRLLAIRSSSAAVVDVSRARDSSRIRSEVVIAGVLWWRASRWAL